MHSRAFVPSRKEDGIEPQCIADHLSPVGRRMVLSIPCQSLIVLLPRCIPELFILFICGENVYGRSNGIDTVQDIMRVSLRKCKTMPTHSISFKQWVFVLCCSGKNCCVGARIKIQWTVGLINHTNHFHFCVCKVISFCTIS